MAEKKKASKLLPHIFNADPKKVREFFENPKEEAENGVFTPFRFLLNLQKTYKDYQSYMITQLLPKEVLSKPKETKRTAENVCTVLMRSSCKEEYFESNTTKSWHSINPNTNSWLSPNTKSYKRIWRSISPLEAAAWCGDIFLVKELLKYVPASQYKIAADQLKGILDRKESKENGSFFAPFKTLFEAYQCYLKDYDMLYEAAQEYYKIFEEIYEKQRQKIEVLYAMVNETQRRLPTYGIQEFCDENPFYPLPSFDKEPSRSCFFRFGHRHGMRYGDRKIFEIYLIPEPKYVFFSIPDDYALHKGKSSYACMTSGLNNIRGQVRKDSDAIEHLLSVRRINLMDIIDGLNKSSVKDNSQESEPDKSDLWKSIPIALHF